MIHRTIRYFFTNENLVAIFAHMIKSQFLLEVSAGTDSASASIPLQTTCRNLDEPTSFKICAHCTLTILNVSHRIISFKVLTNAPNRYSIRPAIGILQPSQSLDIFVGVSRKHASDPAGVILLRYVKLPDDWSVKNDLASFWSNAPKENVKAVKLVQSVFEPDPSNYSMHSSFSEPSSAHGNGSPAIDAESDLYATPATANVPLSQPRSAENDRERLAAASEAGERSSANVAGAPASWGDPSRTNGADKHCNEGMGFSRPPANTGLQSARVAEVSHVPRGDSSTFNHVTSFMPVEVSRQNIDVADSANDAGCIAGHRSDSRTSTLSDSSHRTDDARLGIDQDIVQDFEKMRAAVSSVRVRPKLESQTYAQDRTRAKDTDSSEIVKSNVAGPVDEPSSRAGSGMEACASLVSGETSATTQYSNYPPVEACVSSISRLTSANSFLSRLFPSASLSDQPVLVRMDRNMLQLFEGKSETSLLLKIRWKDVVALSVCTGSTAATILLLVHGNSGNKTSCVRDIKVCDSLVSDVHHTLHLMSIKGSAETACRMAVHASRCHANNTLPTLPHVRLNFCS